jgi:hypothetical protein
MIWSNELADFVANSGRPEFREPATQVIRELNKFDNPEAINGIAPMNTAGAVGIGINHQRRMLFLFGALFFFGLLVVFVAMLGPVRLREPETGELSAFVLIIPMFGGFGLLSLLLYLKKPGPEVVVVANPTSLYLVSRHGLRFAPKEVLVPWSSDRVHIDLNTVTHNMITTHTVSLSRVRRDTGRKSRVFSARVDEQLFRYWQQFAQVIARFM